MKAGWALRRLEEVVDFYNGLWTGKKPPFEKVGVIRNTNFTKDCELDYSDIAYLDVEKSQFIKRKLQYGDLILEKSGGGPKQPVGRVVIFNKYDGDYSFSNFTSAIRTKESIIDFQYLHKFLFYSYMNGITEKMQSHSTGIRNLKLDEYKAIGVPIPPLPEQKRIVTLLDKAFAAIAKAKEYVTRNLANARELFESYLQGVFAYTGEGWEEKRLEEIGETQTGTTPATSDRENYGNYIPFITPADIDFRGDGSIQYRSDGLSEQGLKKGRKMEKNSILMVCIGASIGKVGIVDREVSCNQQINSLTVKRTYNPKFFYYALRTKRFYEQVINNSAQMTLPIINKGKWEKLTISYPVVNEEQRAIVAKLDALSNETKKLESIYQKKLNALDELKKSILDKAFKGEL